MSAEVFNSSRAQFYSSSQLGEKATYENHQELNHPKFEGQTQFEDSSEHSNASLVAVLGGLSFLCVGKNIFLKENYHFLI